MEIYVLELGKLPPEDQNEEGIVRWMRLFQCKEPEGVGRDGKAE